MNQVKDYSEEYLGLEKPVNFLTPIISVRLLTYNHKEFISQAIDSVLMQETDFPFEIVIGEDDSTDGTREICKQYAEKHPDIIRLLLRSEKNKIYIDEVKTGRFNFVETIKACRGSYIALLDGDDYWTDKFKLQKQVMFLKQNTDYVVTGYPVNLIKNNKVILKHFINNPITFSSEEMSKIFKFFPTSSMCFRNVIVFPAEFFKVINGDTFLNSLLGVYGKGRLMENIEPGIYRIHQKGMWNALSFKKKLNSHMNTYYQMSSYYNRIHKDELSDYYKVLTLNYSKILNNKVYFFYYLFKHEILYHLRNFIKN